jgi:hypothetical protein
VETPRADVPKDLAALREWVAALERRVGELEHAERELRRRRRRSTWVLALALLVYFALFAYLTQSLPG